MPRDTGWTCLTVVLTALLTLGLVAFTGFCCFCGIFAGPSVVMNEADRVVKQAPPELIEGLKQAERERQAVKLHKSLTSK